MKILKSTIKYPDKVVHFDTKQFGTLDEAIEKHGYTRTLILVNYAFALTQRATERRKRNVKGNLRGMCHKVKT